MHPDLNGTTETSHVQMCWLVTIIALKQLLVLLLGQITLRAFRLPQSWATLPNTGPAVWRRYTHSCVSGWWPLHLTSLLLA